MAKQKISKIKASFSVKQRSSYSCLAGIRAASECICVNFDFNNVLTLSDSACHLEFVFILVHLEFNSKKTNHNSIFGILLLCQNENLTKERKLVKVTST